MSSSNTFTFLNSTNTISSPQDWNNPETNKLWLYNLHYFDDLNADNSKMRIHWHQELIERWINENPVGYGIGWDPYPISLRIVNWIKWHLNNNILSQNALNSLTLQARYLNRRIEYHLLANHLFTNAKALIFAGLFFRGKEAEEWFSKGFGIFTKQLSEQVLPDGGNFERSPMYHSIMLEDILDILTIFRIYNHPTVTKEHIVHIESVVRKMLLWLHAVCHPDDQLSLFNDSAFSIAPAPRQLSDYANNLGIKHDAFSPEFSDLTETGYYSIKQKLFTLIIDAGNIGPDYQPGHAHADTLSFELSCGKQRIFVNSGTSTYAAEPERLRQRGTAAHNTLTINTYDSSEVWSSFRVARRAKIVERSSELNNGIYRITAAHNGYKRLRGVRLHRRTWVIHERKIIIGDTVEGKGRQLLEAHFHFHPDVVLHSLNDNGFRIEHLSGYTDVYFDNRLTVLLQNSTYHPEFGLSVTNKEIICSGKVTLPFSFTTTIEF